MARIWKYLLFFLLCLAVALVVNLPVRQVLPHVELPNTVKLTGVDGSVMQGRAQQINLNRFPLRDVRFRFEPSCLPLLKLCYQLEYEQGTTGVAYDLLNGDTEFSDTRVEYSMDELTPYLPNMLVQPDGRLEFMFDDLTIVGGRPATINGKLIWRDLGIKDDSSDLNLGDFQVDISGNQQKYDFKLSDLDASLDVDGKGNVVAGGAYSIDVKISSESPIESKVKGALDLFATSEGYNKYRISKAGRLPPNITGQIYN